VNPLASASFIALTRAGLGAAANAARVNRQDAATDEKASVIRVPNGLIQFSKYFSSFAKPRKLSPLASPLEVMHEGQPRSRAQLNRNNYNRSAITVNRHLDKAALHEYRWSHRRAKRPLRLIKIREVTRMSLKKKLLGLLLAIMFVPAMALAEEKNGTVSTYDKESRMLTVKGKDWEQKAKVSSSDAKDKGDLLKEGSKVKVEFDDRGGGDVRVKSLSGR
jgi:hypothetical protein